MSTFDPASFLDAVTTEAYVKASPLPEGEYTAIIKDIVPREWSSNRPDAKLKNGVALDVILTVEIPADIRAQMNSDFTTTTLTDSIMFGTLPDFDKNRHLGSYREATGTNTSGEAFSPRNLIGKVVLVKTTLKEGLYAKVARVARHT